MNEKELKETVDRFNFLNGYDPSHPLSIEEFTENFELDKLFEESVKEHHKLYGNEDKNNLLSFLPEGIDYDDNHNVWFTPDKEENVDTSVYNNPTVNQQLGNNIQVLSIFKRKRSTSHDQNSDGNPLLYAFKKEGWRFRTPKDKALIVQQMEEIIKKFNSTHKYVAAIFIPSGSSLNYFIANLVKKINPSCITINDTLVKLKADEVYKMLKSPNSKFTKTYGINDQEKNNRLNQYINLMKQKRMGNFTYHFIKDPDIRNTVEQTMKLSDNFGKYSESINDKDVLIVDDSISRGNSIKEACNIIASTFIPRSITVLTMFSPVY
jgi:hypoxanthine-guanine phosphoribosyltransferase